MIIFALVLFGCGGKNVDVYDMSDGGHVIVTLTVQPIGKSTLITSISPYRAIELFAMRYGLNDKDLDIDGKVIWRLKKGGVITPPKFMNPDHITIRVVSLGDKSVTLLITK